MNEKNIEKLELACIKTDELFSELIQGLKKKKFKSEKQIQKFILNEIKKKNCSPSFPPICASGKNGANPHAKPASKLNKGFMVLDFGCAFKGIKADMTRTIYLGKPSALEKKLYNKVLFVQKKLISEAKHGKKASDLYKKMFSLLGDLAFACPHGLGHGVSTKIHDKPSLKRKSKDILKENDTITIEPGIYFPKFFGIRIEDTILIQRKGNKILTKSPKKLIVISFK
ncbi:MAG: M24 family metallopeptidase [Candidatus Diapherotrites archaeon]|nr:M24 family metallopeptidase [Candidatus Diapherotrites archaeon]